jgi:Domain of unknown function (DUF305)
VQFAKAMIVHHAGAVEMARAYHANPQARNGFLGLMNVDIVTDQTQEIALMRAVIAAYPGDAGRVRVDPSMIHGMEGMAHGVSSRGAHGGPYGGPRGAAQARPAPREDRTGHGGHAGHAASADAPRAQPRPAPSTRPSAQRPAPAGAAHGAHHRHDHGEVPAHPRCWSGLVGRHRRSA